MPDPTTERPDLSLDLDLGPSWHRLVYYAVAMLAIGFVGYAIGVTWFEASGCGGTEADGECDMAAFGGLAGALIALPVGGAVLAVVDVLVTTRRRRSRSPS